MDLLAEFFGFFVSNWTSDVTLLALSLSSPPAAAALLSEVEDTTDRFLNCLSLFFALLNWVLNVFTGVILMEMDFGNRTTREDLAGDGVGVGRGRANVWSSSLFFSRAYSKALFRQIWLKILEHWTSLSSNEPSRNFSLSKSASVLKIDSKSSGLMRSNSRSFLVSSSCSTHLRIPSKILISEARSREAVWISETTWKSIKKSQWDMPSLHC